MKCRECGVRSKYPICPSCAGETETGLLEKLKDYDARIPLNKKEIQRRSVQMPTVSHDLWIVLLIFFAGIILVYYLNQIHQVIALQVFSYALLCAFFPLFLFLFWGRIPQKDVNNGLSIIDLKYENLVMARHTKWIIDLLKKCEHNWSKDDKLSIRFNSLES